MAYGFTLTVLAGNIPSSQVDFNWLAVASNFPIEAIDGGASSLLNGGGNLRCYTDSTKATRVPVEIVTFVTGGTPVVEIWGLSPALADNSTVYIEADDAETTQPPVSAPFGRNAVWVNYLAVYHCADSNYTDSAGSYDLLVSGAGAPTLTSAPNGTGAYDFTGLSASLKATVPLMAGATETLGVYVTFIHVSGSVVYAAGFNDAAAGGRDLSLGSYNSGSRTSVLSYNSGAFELPVTTSAGAKPSESKVFILYSPTPGSTLTGGLVDGNEAYGVGSLKVSTRNYTEIGLGGRIDNSPNYYDCETSEVRFTHGELAYTDDRRIAEVNTETSPVLFWSASAWVDLGGGALAVPVSLTSSSYMAFNSTIELAGITEILAQLTSSTYSYFNLSIEQTGINDILSQLTSSAYSEFSAGIEQTGANDISASSTSSTYSLFDFDVDLTGINSIQSNLTSSVYSAFAASISTTAQLTVNAQTTSSAYEANSVSIQLTGLIDIDAGETSSTYLANNAIIELFGITDIDTLSTISTYNPYALAISDGIKQNIGTVTAGFKNNAYTVQYNTNSTTVYFKE